jgi:hypothetical protein
MSKKRDKNNDDIPERCVDDLEIRPYRMSDIREIYTVYNLTKDEEVGLVFFDEYHKALVVVDIKNKEIIMHDLPNIVAKRLAEIMKQDEKWKDYLFCNA